ncbi:MAG: hypothetical protein R3B59_00155 [Dehalococcoidia bacterium]
MTTAPLSPRSADDIPELHPAADVPGGEHFEPILRASIAGTDLADTDIHAHFTTDGSRDVAEQIRATIVAARVHVGGGEILGYYGVPGAICAVVRGQDGHLRNVGSHVREADGYRARNLLGGPRPSGFTVRPAVPEDGPTLARLERSAPIQMGNVGVVYDRGEDDYFAGDRLAAANVLVLERDGDVVGMGGTVVHDVRINGHDARMAYAHRFRIALSAQRGGAWGALQWPTWLSNAAHSDAGSSYIHRANEAMLRYVPPAVMQPVGPERLAFRTVELAEDASMRPATAEDAPRIVELLNSTHGGEALFRPYTVESLTERVQREPSSYSWSLFRLSDRAVVGAWWHAYRVLRMAEGESSEDVRTLVLDYGFEPGAEAEFTDLLRAVAAEAAAGGSSELTMFTSPSSPGYDSLRPLAHHVDGYAMTLGAFAHGGVISGAIYIDQLYF